MGKLTNEIAFLFFYSISGVQVMFPLLYLSLSYKIDQRRRKKKRMECSGRVGLSNKN